MPYVLPLNEMTLDKKLQAMEAIWEDLSRNPDDVPSPAWHGEVLRERQRQLDAGETKPVAWDKAQREIDRLVALGSESATALAQP